MIASLVYALCAVASIVCAVTLFRSYSRGKTSLLLWCSVCFIGLALNNILLFVDLVVIPHGPDLSLLRTFVAFGGFGSLLFGLIWEMV